MAQGTVRWFNPESGYGFIIDDESGQDLFVRYSDIEGTGFRTLQEDPVSYTHLTLPTNREV